MAITPGERLSFLAAGPVYKYDEYPVLDTVIMGNARLYEIMKEKEVDLCQRRFHGRRRDPVPANLEAEFATHERLGG